jgi:peptide deformylase
MTVKKILVYPNDKLKQVSNKSELNVENLKNSVKDLLDTIRHYEGNKFLTSTQIDSEENLAIFDLQMIYNKEFKNDERFLIIVNPEIIDKSKETISFQETSGSTPFFQCTSTKSKSVKVKFDVIKIKQENIEKQNENENDVAIIKGLDVDDFTFEQQIITFWDDMSIVMQSAIDQLNGKCFLDNLSWFNKSRYMKKHKNQINLFKKLIKKNMLQGFNNKLK